MPTSYFLHDSQQLKASWAANRSGTNGAGSYGPCSRAHGPLTVLLKLSSQTQSNHRHGGLQYPTEPHTDTRTFWVIFCPLIHTNDMQTPHMDEETNPQPWRFSKSYSKQLSLQKSHYSLYFPQSLI